MNSYLTFIIIMLVLFPCTVNINPPRLHGFTVHLDSVSYKNDIILLPALKNIKITFYGNNLSQVNSISFTSTNASGQSMCDSIRSTEAFPMLPYGEFADSEINLRPFTSLENYFFICLGQIVVLNNNHTAVIWFHQGFKTELVLQVFETMLPFWLIIVLILVMFLLSGLFSGLNLGLMSLSLTDLHLFVMAGSPKEKKYAKIIAPVRHHGNFLLATLLLGNVLVNSTLTILIDEVTGSGFLGVIGSTIGIVIFGEIIPQSVTSRHALVIGAKTMWITKFFMVLTFVLSFPIGKVLDKMLGKELGVVYSREKLELLIKQQQLMGAVVKDEVNIITGALNLTTKTAKDIMTSLDNAFMLPYSSVLDFDLLNQIVRNGFTRIPVFEGERNNIMAVLNIKDLTLLDPDENIPLATVCSFYKRPIMLVPSHTILREMLEEFKKGKTHLAFVAESCGNTEKDLIVGLVTLEDVIEEIIQAEIIDETDVFFDNVERTRRSVIKQDFSMFHETGKSSILAPQVKLTALQHLYSDISSFREDLINFNVLKSLLNADIVVEFHFSSTNKNLNVMIPKAKLLNHAILLLHGRVSVFVSNENLYFESGPFAFFGETVLKNINSFFPIIDLNKDLLSDIFQRAQKNCCFTPDYSVVALENVQYLLIKMEHYIFARFLSQKKNDLSASKSINRALISFEDEWKRFSKKTENKLDTLGIDVPQNNNNPEDLSESSYDSLGLCEVNCSELTPLLIN